MTASEIRNDAFGRKLLAKVPADIRDTFSDAQLIALKAGAIGGIESGKHPIDFRHSVKFWRWKHYYFVFVAGRNKGARDLAPREERIAHVLGLATVAIHVVALSIFGYATLSWFGISDLLLQDTRM